MKTPFTAYFEQANAPITRVSRRPFVPHYPMDYVLPENQEYHVGDGCQLSYHWHDGFDVFVAKLEARFAHMDGARLEIPIASHLSDLHLVYQLLGDSHFLPVAPSQAAPLIALPAQHHIQVYAPPGRAIIRIRPDRKTRHFVLAVIVPKGNWVTRHPTGPEDPLAPLIHLRKAELGQHQHIGPSPLTPTELANLHLLLSLPSYPDMLMDDELNGPMVKLIHSHRMEYGQQEEKLAREQWVEAARILAEQLVVRYNSGEPLTVAEVANALHTDARTLNHRHKKIHKVSFSHHIERLRLEHAKTLLESGISITDTALKMGYSSASNFARSFRVHTEQTPSEYLRKKP